MLFDRIVFPVLNHVDLQASESEVLDGSNQFYGFWPIVDPHYNGMSII